MEKPTLKRLALGLLQHILAGIIMTAIAWLLFNSNLSVPSMDGTQTYRISPLNTEPVFEESELFNTIFSTAVSDVTRLVVIKGQLETNGRFDPQKHIDVTQYANRKNSGNECSATAVYELEDLIKWGKYGLEYSYRAMSISDFVNYFGSAVSVRNYAIDEYGQLYFAGFRERDTDGTAEETLSAGSGDYTDYTVVAQAMDMFTTEQLEDMCLSYIMSQVSWEDISVSREDDGSITVYFPMLNCRYATVDGERQLVPYADNWVDYTKLQDNLVQSIESLTENYEKYQNSLNLYQEDSNFKYVVRMLTEDGMCTYTNIPEMQWMEDNLLTDYFAEFRSYLIYYPDSLDFMGNTGFTEEQIAAYINQYDYAYSETTHIWMGVDVNYAAEGDAFYNAYKVFERIVPNIHYILLGMGLIALMCLSITLYLTITAGVGYSQEGQRVLYLNGIDHIWIEIVIGITAVMVYAGYRGGAILFSIAENVYLNHYQLREITVARIYEYGAFALFGFLASMCAHLVWYSLVRRFKSKNLWKDSFLHFLCQSIYQGIQFVFRHRNTAVSTLLPYNTFLLVNLMGMLGIYMMQEYRFIMVFIIIALVVFDGLIGVFLFRDGAEQIDIVEGINRIREGEVDYKLDADALHGANKEMADAVNNIGEGIRNAVKTSMKDEQLKTDLITNVSHDIKTPLTSIINYVDLLKRLKIMEEPAKSYIEVLETKSQRLKQLTDDLVEVSKISSGNIELQREKINLTELLNQAIGEFSEKLEERNLTLVFEGNDISAYIYADSRRMWRIIENLFNNVCKYAMESTRVYIDLIKEEDVIELSIKNISARQMNIRSEELTERFIRGDSARSTEGSGLGLSIAKSLTQVHGGEFNIYLDGDLFKVVLGFPVFQEKI